MENTTDTQLSPFEQAKQEATEKISSMTVDEIAGYIAGLKIRIDEINNIRQENRNRLQQLVDTVTEFIKENLEEGASHDDLKQLANDLEIELTKTVKVEMKISYYADLIVPIDFDIENINESDFEVNISCNTSSETEVDDESTEIDDFSAEEE